MALIRILRADRVRILNRPAPAGPHRLGTAPAITLWHEREHDDGPQHQHHAYARAKGPAAATKLQARLIERANAFEDRAMALIDAGVQGGPVTRAFRLTYLLDGMAWAIIEAKVS